MALLNRCSDIRLTRIHEHISSAPHICETLPSTQKLYRKKKKVYIERTDSPS